jgi:hypothetical protein
MVDGEGKKIKALIADTSEFKSYIVSSSILNFTELSIVRLIQIIIFAKNKLHYE